MRILIIAAVMAQALAAAGAGPAQVTIEAMPPQARLHRNDLFDVELHTINHTDRTQPFRIMKCSWVDQWKTDDAQLTTSGAECEENFETTLALAPGASDVRTLSLHVDKRASLGTHTFRLGFTPIGGRDTLWSAAVTIDVVAVGSGIALSATHDQPRTIVFSVKNTTAQPIELADHLVLQRLAPPAGHWADMTWISATRCAAPPQACVVVAPGATLAATPWLGMTCGQCTCHASTFAEPGEYRLVAQSCDGKTDYMADNNQATVTLPARP